ncbi:hypothetical protein [Streptomyces sp. NPDC048242]|uniref:hypothetical protein n=1 Tax=Streptomyces sp. NPDC048242 TaxID=3155026 RepID=UPI00342CB36D
MSETVAGSGARRYNTRNFLIGLVIVGFACGAFLLYFMKGLYLLPGNVCDASVQRDTVIRILPRARSADQWAGQGSSGRHFSYGCRVSTSGDSILSGQVDVRDTSEASWASSYSQGHSVLRASKGGVEALAANGGRSVSLYIPCVPAGVEAGDARQGYALVADAGVLGKSRATGAELREALTDFLYQFTRHAYDVAECKPQRDLPKRLPPYKQP